VEGAAGLSSSTRAGGHVSWLSARYDRYIAVGLGGVTGDVSGHRLNNSPEWSGRMWLEWTGSAGGVGNLSLRGEARWQSTVFFTPFNDAVQRQTGYALLDASAELGPAKRWSVTIYGRNLTNTGYITGSFGTPLPAFGGRPGPPRQVGVRLSIER
jgi:iron complex outermembrane receptor protein